MDGDDRRKMNGEEKGKTDGDDRGKMNRETMDRKKKVRREAIITALKTASGADFTMSFFLTVKKGEHILDASFLYAAGNFNTVWTRPFASAVFEPETGAVLVYRNCYVDDFADSSSYPMTCRVDYAVPFAKTAEEQGELVKRIQELYFVIRLLPWKESLDEKEKRAAGMYRDSFFKAVPKGLLPFYQALSPEFYEWLGDGFV